MNVREFLKSERLSVVWLQEQLRRRGHKVDLSDLCKIIKGERNGEKSQLILEVAKEICAKYESL